MGKIILIVLIIAIPIYGIYGTISGAVNNNIGDLVSGIACLAITLFVVAAIVITTKIENKSKKYLTEHFEEVKTLSKKYASIANDYITKLKALDYSLFTVSYNKTKNLIISFYWQQKPNLLLNKIYQYDGFEKPKSNVNLVLPNEDKAKKLTENVILELKNIIHIDNSWTDKYTLPCLIYFIIRNNIIETLESQANNIIPKGRENYDNERTKICKTVGKTIDIDEENHDDTVLIESETTNEQEQRNVEAMRQMQKEARQRKAEQEQKQREWFWEQQRKEREEQERREQEKREREQKSIEYLNEHKYVLVEKYSEAAFNFIEKILESGYTPFIYVFKGTITPQSSILVYPYRDTNSQILKENILKDGLEFTESDNADMNKKIQDITTFFVSELKNRIINKEWQDNFTLPLLLYFIIRNSVIKYYHDKYVEKLGYESLEEFCLTYPNATSSVATIYYTYYKIYETNIDLPLMDTYQKICEEAKEIIKVQKQKKLENDLFGKPKKQTVAVNDTPYTLSPIERIDRMTGEQFEIFMEDYFIKQGFKVTRTPLSGDYGIDLIIENDFSKIGVQAKCYSNKVTASAVQEVVTGLRHYGLSGGMVVTNNYFQPAAIQLAKDNGITLWNRDKFIEKLNK